MVLHYKTYHNNYLCNPIIKPNENKMVNSVGDVDCEDCKDKIKDYESEAFTIIESNHVQTDLLSIMEVC